MPLFVYDGKTVGDLPDFLTTPGHAAVDHDGLPGVGDLTTAAHAAADHAGIPGVGDLTTAAHALVDHAGIPGAGIRGVRVLDATTTYALLQAALNDATVRVVYLLPGTYQFNADFSSQQIDIPEGKSLIGLTGNISRHQVSPSYSSSYQPVFDINVARTTTNALFRVRTYSRMAGIVVDATGMTGSANGRAIEVVGPSAKLEDVLVDSWMSAGTGTASAVLLESGSLARNIFVYRSRGHCFEVTNGNDRGPNVLEQCTAYNSLAGDGFRLSNACQLIACFASVNALSGFRGHTGCSDQKLMHCVAAQNTGDGFNWTNSSGSDGTILLGCSALQNSAWGYLLTAATGGRPGLIGSSARANASGNFNIPGWQNFSNWAAS